MKLVLIVLISQTTSMQQDLKVSNNRLVDANNAVNIDSEYLKTPTDNRISSTKPIYGAGVTESNNTITTNNAHINTLLDNKKAKFWNWTYNIQQHSHS